MIDYAGKKALVTGGAGFIGAHLSRLLAGAGARVVVFDDLSAGSLNSIRGLLDSGSASFAHGDIRNFSAVRDAARDAEAIFHLAVLNLRECMTRAEDAREINIGGAENVCRAAAESGAALIHVSTSDIYGNVAQYPTPESIEPKPTTIYGETKLEAEGIVEQFRREAALPAVIVRPFNTYGPGEHITGSSGEVLPRFILYALEGKPLPVFGDGTQTRSFTFVEDTARGIAAAASLLPGKAPDTPVNIARPDEVSMLEAARLALEALGRPDNDIEFLPPRPGDVARQVPDVSLAKKLLGFEARFSLKDGLPRLVEWVRQSGARTGDAPRLWPGA